MKGLRIKAYNSVMPMKVAKEELKEKRKRMIKKLCESKSVEDIHAQKNKSDTFGLNTSVSSNI